LDPKLHGQPMAQLHRSHQSPVIRQSGTGEASVAVIDVGTSFNDRPYDRPKAGCGRIIRRDRTLQV
jgi:hypothetical protein